MVCVGPVRKPHCWFSHKAAHIFRKLNVLQSFFNVVGIVDTASLKLPVSLYCLGSYHWVFMVCVCGGGGGGEGAG